MGDLISLEVLKQHLRLDDDTSEDQIVQLYRDAAIAHLDGPEGWLGRSLQEREYVCTFDNFAAVKRLPYPPIVTVTKVERLDGSVWVDLDEAGWEVVEGSLLPVRGGRWPSGAARVTYRAGYNPDEDRPLPKPLLVAILLMTEDLYRNRGEVVIGASAVAVPMSASVAALLSPFRVWAI